MKFLLLGEGPSDLYWEELPEGGIRKGLMTRLLEEVWHWFSGMPIEGILYRRQQVAEIRKRNKRHLGNRIDMPQKPYAGVYQYAVILAQESQEKYHNAPAVFFHDADRTQAQPANTDTLLMEAMDAGFQSRDFQRGIPMVPNPRQEAWLLAHYQKYLPGCFAYQNSSRWEKLSGNDNATPRNNAKKLLEQALCRGHIKDLTDDFSSIDWHRVDMPSFLRFVRRVREVAEALGGKKERNK